MDNKKTLISLIGGIGVTLITGLIPNRTLLGATHYGWLLTWRIHLVLAPQHNPWKILPVNFLLDTVLWGIIIFIILRYYERS
jgi:hypothetical protein